LDSYREITISENPEQSSTAEDKPAWYRRRKRLTIFFGLLILYSIATGNLPIWRLYKAAPIEGSVIDAKTRQPLSGVVVVANWHLKRTALHGTTNLGALWLAETVTDENGHYSIPGQSLTLAPAFSWFGYSGPYLYFFKPSYMPLIKNNPQNGAWSAADKNYYRTSVWDGATIELARPSSHYIKVWGGPERARFISVQLFAGDLKRDILYRENCEWEKIPKMIVALDKDLLDLEKEGYRERGIVKPSIFSIKRGLASARSDNHCSDPEKIIGAYQ